jgi:hypothetical protein
MCVCSYFELRIGYWFTWKKSSTSLTESSSLYGLAFGLRTNVGGWLNATSDWGKSFSIFELIKERICLKVSLLAFLVRCELSLLMSRQVSIINMNCAQTMRISEVQAWDKSWCFLLLNLKSIEYYLMKTSFCYKSRIKCVLSSE